MALPAAVALDVAAALLLGFAALVLRRRAPPRTPEANSALHAFAWAWAALAGISLVAALRGALVMGGIVDAQVPTVALTAMQLAYTALLALGLWGVMRYVAFVVTGLHAIRYPVALAYFALFATAAWASLAAAPYHVAVSPWTTRLVGEGETPAVVGVAFGVALLAQIVASLVLIVLAARSRDGNVQRRGTLIGSSLLVIFAAPFVGTLSGADSREWWPLALRVLSVLSAFTAVLAYRRPPEPSLGERHEHRRDALMARVRELV